MMHFLFLQRMEAERKSQQQPEPVQEQTSRNKVKITFDEYQRLSVLITGILKKFEHEGQESVQQSEVVNRVIQSIVLDEGAGTSVEKAAETAKKVSNVIHNLISKENVVVVTQDSKVKNERLLCLNINFEMSALNMESK